MNKWQKIWRFAGLFLCPVLLLSGCRTTESEDAVLETEESVLPEEIEEAETEEGMQPEEEIEEMPEGLSAKTTKTVKEAYGDDTFTLLTKTVNDISVNIPDNEHAQELISAFFQERNEAWEDTVDLYVDVVVDAFEAWEEGGKETNWEGYEIGRTYELKRLDEQMLCVLEDTFVKKGGKKADHVRVAYNFDTWTGKRLSLEEAGSHLDEIRLESLAYIGNLLQKEEYAGILKSNYTEYLEDMLTDSTWYTDEKGMYVICNEDIIAPASAGILEFFLPYEEVDVIDDVYQPEISD